MKKKFPVNNTYLSEREMEVLQLLCSGYANKQVAGALLISIKTVEKHRSRLNMKLGVNCMIGMLRVALRNNLVSYLDWLGGTIGEARHLDCVSGQQIKLPSPLCAGTR
jgi:hypothetical protein